MFSGNSSGGLTMVHHDQPTLSPASLVPGFPTDRMIWASQVWGPRRPGLATFQPAWDWKQLLALEPKPRLI